MDKYEDVYDNLPYDSEEDRIAYLKKEGYIEEEYSE